MSHDRMIVSLREPKEIQKESIVEQSLEPRMSKKRHLSSRRPLMIGAVVFILLVIGVFLVSRQYMNSAETSANENVRDTSAINAATTANLPETADLLARAGALIVLPEGEEPTIATVTDPEKLQDQAFFANAKTGDKVLIYTRAKKAYLFDPVANKLIEVAPLTVDVP